MKTKKPSTLFRLIGYTKPYAPLIVISFIASIASVAVSILIPLMTGYAIDYMIEGAVDFDKVFKYIYIIVAMIVVGAIAQWTLSASVNSLTCKTVRNIRNQLFEHINNLPLKYIDTQRQGDIIARISSDIDQVSEGLLQGFTQLFSGVLTIGATLGILFYLNWIIALVVLVLTPLSLCVAAFITKRSHKTFAAQAVKRGEVSGYVEEIFTGRSLIQAFCQEDICQEDFEKLNKELYDCGFKSQFYGALINPCTRFVNNLVYASVGVVGALISLWAGSPKGLPIGLLSTCLTYANQYTKPFNEITGVITEIQSAVAASRRIFALLDQPVEESDSQNQVLEHCDGTLDIDGVYFSYVPEKPLIQGLNLHVKQGQKIAIVGPTGCGKTTLINLLMRFYDVNEGSISMSGKDIRQITRTSLRDSYGMVLQESWLFEGTIKDNIAYGKQDATLEEIMDAAQLAGADDFIEKFPDKYDTLLTENGDNISQGQRQLLCIARIMLTHPPMLILDEATSSIDTRTEMKIQEAFYRIMQGRTSFIVAHRLSTIRSCDVILVMKDGNIIEQGNHEELLAKQGFYYELYNSQFANSSAS
ncbi:MAG: ABC transporter ATP-binding protein/permease [Clostridia bacterium]|nr:ABC transporter ATP-binding protein/permease [Clostridia bacterium]